MDGDKEGRKGARNAYSLIKSNRFANYQCVMVNLRDIEDEKDPDKYLIKYDVDALKRYITKTWEKWKDITLDMENYS